MARLCAYKQPCITFHFQQALNLDTTSRPPQVHEVEERKNAHIADLMARHRRAFEEIKNYYNDITHNNLDLIKVGGACQAWGSGLASAGRAGQRLVI